MSPKRQYDVGRQNEENQGDDARNDECLYVISSVFLTMFCLRDEQRLSYLDHRKSCPHLELSASMLRLSINLVEGGSCRNDEFGCGKPIARLKQRRRFDLRVCRCRRR